MFVGEEMQDKEVGLRAPINGRRGHRNGLEEVNFLSNLQTTPTEEDGNAHFVTS